MNSLSFRSRAGAALVLAATTIGFGLLPSGPARSADTAFAAQLVTVRTPTRQAKEVLNGLGLDLTEHAGHDYIEVVLHTAADERALRVAGLTWDVRIADLVAREARNNAINARYAAATLVSPMPSGRDSYRTLEDYNADMAKLVADHPGLVKPIALNHPSIEGKTIQGVEIGSDVNEPESGRPVFVMLGLHHAREWPSGEHSIEFAFDLVKGYGTDARITGLLDKARVIVVPVVNPDGFEKSINDGKLVDLRAIGGDAVLATPGNAYKRKNCRMADGATAITEECRASTVPGITRLGVDLNRNYGGFWGGPGASPDFHDETYRGASAFSEPETQGVRELVSERHVTGLITNHTFSNLVLRPNGVSPDTIGPDGYPSGNAPDEAALKALGAKMAAQNGYRNIHGWELYDTTGTTEDWSYNTTGGFGYTFEIGPDEFHPPYPKVIDEYLGAGKYAGKGNREAFLLALESSVDPASHSLLSGTAPAGATLRLKKIVGTSTWNGGIMDVLDTTMRVGPDGTYTWHTNPSTRPAVKARQVNFTAKDPLVPPTTWSDFTPPEMETDKELVITQSGVDLLEVKLDWPTPDDLDLFVFKKNADGTLTELASSANFVQVKERALVLSPAPGTYVLRVVNYASVAPEWTMTASLFDQTSGVVPGLIESWTLSCEKDGKVLQQVAVFVDRGQSAKPDLSECISRWPTA